MRDRNSSQNPRAPNTGATKKGKGGGSRSSHQYTTGATSVPSNVGQYPLSNEPDDPEDGRMRKAYESNSSSYYHHQPSAYHDYYYSTGGWRDQHQQ